MWLESRFRFLGVHCTLSPWHLSIEGWVEPILTIWDRDFGCLYCQGKFRVGFKNSHGTSSNHGACWRMMIIRVLETSVSLVLISSEFIDESTASEDEIDSLDVPIGWLGMWSWLVVSYWFDIVGVSSWLIWSTSMLCWVETGESVIGKIPNSTVVFSLLFVQTSSLSINISLFNEKSCS